MERVSSPVEGEGIDILDRASRTSSRQSSRSRRSSRAGSKGEKVDASSRGSSIARVHMGKDVQDPVEIDRIIEQLKTKPGGLALLEMAYNVTKTPGVTMDLAKASKLLDTCVSKTECGTLKKPTREQYVLPTAPPLPDYGDRSLHVREGPLYGDDSREDTRRVRAQLLNIELNDRTIQRRIVEPPTTFQSGTCSISDKDKARLDKVRVYFTHTFSAKKFSGASHNRMSDSIDILQLLLEFNHAQEVMVLTEDEFVNFLTKSMSGAVSYTHLTLPTIYSV